MFRDLNLSEQAKFVTCNIEKVRGEWKRRGIDGLDHPMPIRFCYTIKTLEVFYLQKEPKLGFWARFENKANFYSCVDQLMSRMPQSNTQHEALEMVQLGDTFELILANPIYSFGLPARAGERN